MYTQYFKECTQLNQVGADYTLVAAEFGKTIKI